MNFYYLLVIFEIIRLTASINPSCTPPVFTVHPKDCCNIPDFFDDSDIEVCKAYRGGEGVLRPVEGLQKSDHSIRLRRFATSRMEFGTCYLDCVFSIRAVKLAGNAIDYERLRQILVSETPTEPDSINAIAQAVIECRSHAPGFINVAGDCFSIPASLMMCVHQKYFLTCPPSRWSNNDDCNLLRNYLLVCPPPLF